MARLVDERGASLRLGEKLGEGGEGAVFRLWGSDSHAVKLYWAPLTAARVEKIRVLTSLNRPELNKVAAWPSGLVLDEIGQARGLLLPVIESAKDIHELYSPRSRREHFPTADWGFLVHVSTNVARAFAAVHSLGLVIGDVNPRSIMVVGDGTVRLIDVDSFQVPVQGRSPLLCTVGVELFLPPELHGASLTSVVRTPSHDCFGLAITIFQLLMLGRHPFAGRFSGAGEMTPERAILEHRFAFGAHAASRGMQPPPNAVGVEILAPNVANLFEYAFAPPTGRPRPSANEWLRALSQMKAGLVQCRGNQAHRYHRSLSVCPWCDAERKTGAILFETSSPKRVQDSGYEADYRDLIRIASAIPVPVPVNPDWAATSVVPQPAAVEAGRLALSAMVGYTLGVLLAIVGVVQSPGGVPIILLGMIVAALGARRNSRRREQWVAGFCSARTAQSAASVTFERANAFPAYAAARQAADRAKNSWDDLPRLRAEKYRDLERDKRRLQLEHFLETQLIELAKIRDIGPGRVTMLSAFGIDTAADIERWRIEQIPQFGPKRTERLVAWRRDRESAFVYDRSRPLPPDVLIRLEREIEGIRRRVVEDLRRALHDLRRASVSEPVAAAAAAQRLRAATLALSQAEADVLAATGKVPA